jgi:hypothetical protein
VEHLLRTEFAEPSLGELPAEPLALWPLARLEELGQGKVHGGPEFVPGGPGFGGLLLLAAAAVLEDRIAIEIVRSGARSFGHGI